MRALRLIKWLFVLVIVCFASVSWETSKAQGIGEAVSLTVPISGTVAPETDPIMTPALPFCIINVARSVEYVGLPELNNWSYLVYIDMHVPLREESCQYTYAISYKTLTAVRVTTGINCTAVVSFIKCEGVLSSEGGYTIEIFTDDTALLSRAFDYTNGVEFWWFFLAFRQWGPIMLSQE